MTKPTNSHRSGIRPTCTPRVRYDASAREISRPSRATKHTYGGDQASRPRPSSGVLLGGNSAIDHPMPLENQAQNATNVLPFRRNSLREPPLCAQCRAPMKIDRCEPDFENSISMVVTYRCPECSLLERAQIQD